MPSSAITGFLVHVIAVSCTHQFKLCLIRACHTASLRSVAGPFIRSAVRCKVALGRLSRISVSTPSAIERSQRYAERNSMEALETLRLAKKTRQLTATQPHRDLKNAEKDKKRQVIEMLSSTPKTSLIGVISRSDFEVPLRAIGGMVFDRVFEQIRKDEVSPDDKSKIRSLAIAHGGHWKKLESLLFRASKKQL